MFSSVIVRFYKSILMFQLIIKLDLLVPTLHVVLKVMCEKPEDDDGEEDYFSSDPDDDTLLTSACECLDDIALNTEAELLIPHIVCPFCFV